MPLPAEDWPRFDGASHLCPLRLDCQLRRRASDPQRPRVPQAQWAATVPRAQTAQQLPWLLRYAEVNEANAGSGEEAAIGRTWRLRLRRGWRGGHHFDSRCWGRLGLAR